MYKVYRSGSVTPLFSVLYPLGNYGNTILCALILLNLYEIPWLNLVGQLQ